MINILLLKTYIIVSFIDNAQICYQYMIWNIFNGHRCQDFKFNLITRSQNHKQGHFPYSFRARKPCSWRVCLELLIQQKARVWGPLFLFILITDFMVILYKNDFFFNFMPTYILLVYIRRLRAVTVNRSNMAEVGP